MKLGNAYWPAALACWLVIVPSATHGQTQDPHAASPQHRQPAPEQPAPDHQPAPHQPAPDQQPAPHRQEEMPPSGIQRPLGMPAERDGSGTSWLPDASAMHALHRQANPWQLMLHGNVFLQYLDEGSDRGDEHFGNTNWIMGMARRNLAHGELTLRSMMSLEGITVGECGYPALLATGEFCEGEPLHDRQHPHDLFMELAAAYGREVTDRLAYEIYGGPVGEPALGPVAFAHRPSAMPNLRAPLAHHWLDSTHITFGVITGGVFGRRWKAESSVFNGREPDEERFDFDFGPLDSVSGRFWFLPTDRWALQVSTGHLNEAERHEDGSRADVRRTTASATYHRWMAAPRIWATTVALGRNTEGGVSTNALLLETAVSMTETDTVFGRLEVAEKTGSDLVLRVSSLDDTTFVVSKFEAGYERVFRAVAGLAPALGGSVSVSALPDRLAPFYGDRSSGGFAIFLSLRPKPMTMRMMGMPHATHQQP